MGFFKKLILKLRDEHTLKRGSEEKKETG